MTLLTAPETISRNTSPAPRLHMSTPRLGDVAVALQNVSLLRLLERIAMRFERVGIPLMVLKGAALQLTVHDSPGDRPMSDLDLMVRPNCARSAMRTLIAMGCRPGRPLVRDDFFPKYHYERDLQAGGYGGLRIDLHARPFRPLRYARTVPADAFWNGAQHVRIGGARVLVPGVEDMLLHLAVHSAVHGNDRTTWLNDLKHWVDAYRERFDWERFVDHAERWRLTLAAHIALTRAEEVCGAIRPVEVRERMTRKRSRWADRRVLKQAPSDAGHSFAHVMTNVLCTPNPRFALGYLRAMLVPDRAHMAEWYDHRHFGWLQVSRTLRLLAPVLRRVSWFWNRVQRTDIREVAGGPAVFATQAIPAGARVFSCEDATKLERPTSLGKLMRVRHNCRPNARLAATKVVALRHIPPGEEITLDWGDHACACRRGKKGEVMAAVPAGVTS